MIKMKLEIEGTPDEVEAICRRIGAIAQTGERPAIERIEGKAVIDGSSVIGPAQSGFMKDAADALVNKMINDGMRAVQEEYALPRKLAGFDEACEVCDAGRCVQPVDAGSEMFIVFSQRNGELHEFSNGSWLAKHSSLRDYFGDDTDPWFEVADPTIAATVEREG